MPGFHHSVAVLPLPFRKFRKSYVSAVRITLPTWKNPWRRCHFHLPLRRNRRSVAIRSNPIFRRSAVAMVDNQSAFWSLHPYVYGKTFPAFSFSPATATAATEWKNGNGMVETREKKWHSTELNSYGNLPSYPPDNHDKYPARCFVRHCTEVWTLW